MSDGLTVTGGSHGLAASYAGMLGLAEAFDAAGDRLRAASAALLQVAADPRLAESALLAPGSFGTAQRALAEAAFGADGIVLQGLAWEIDARAVRGVVAVLRAADQVVAEAIEELDYTAGRVAGTLFAGPLVVSGLVVLGAVALERVGGPDLADPGARPLPDREATQHVLNASGGLVDGLVAAPLGLAGLFLPPLHPTGGSVAGRLAGAYGEPGRPVVRKVSSGQLSTGGATPARDLPGLVRRLDRVRRAEERPGAPAHGTVTVDALTDASGERRHVVHLPGTDDMGTLPWTDDERARDMHGNLRMLAGRDSAYSEGVSEVLEQADIAAGEPVMLVGHSQGGMTALHVADADHDLDADVDIEHVVTLGAPAAHADPAPGTSVLSLENAGDPVPLLDGTDNRDSLAHLTVRFDEPAAGLVAAHGMGAYVAGAEAAKASGHPSVVDRVAEMRDDGFLTGPGAVTVTREVWQVTQAIRPQ